MRENLLASWRQPGQKQDPCPSLLNHNAKYKRLLPPCCDFANGVRSYTDTICRPVHKIALQRFEQWLSFSHRFWIELQAPSARQNPQRMAHTRWTSSHQRRYRQGQVRQHRHASHPIMTVMRRPARGGNDPSSMLRYRGRVAESVA